MKTLVTGACGFIGSHMVEALSEAGHEVVAGDLPSALEADPQDRTRFPEVCRAAGARLAPLDLTEPTSVRSAVAEVELVFHVAAVFDYLAPESLLRAVNVEGTRRLFDALLDEGTCRRVVNWGAGGIYGYPEDSASPFAEDSPKHPTNAYLRSKWDQEVLAHSYRRRGIEVTSVRPVSPYGPRAAYGSGQLLLGLGRKRPAALKNMTGNIPMGHVRDLTAASIHLASLPEANGEAYNVTDDGRMDARVLARIVADELGRKPLVLPALPLRPLRGVLSVVARASTVVARRRGKRPLLEPDQMQYFGRDWRYSNAKLKATGFEMRYPQPEEGIRETLRWYIDHGWLSSHKEPRLARGGI